MEHQEFLLNSAKNLLNNPSDAEDLVQETLLRAVRFQSKFDGKHLRSWLYTILKHLCINHYHKGIRNNNNIKKLKKYKLYGELSNITEEEIQTGSVVAVIEEEIMNLPKIYREVAKCVFLEGLSYQQTADKLSLPIGTVMSKLFRARQILKEVLQELKKEYGIGEDDSNVSV